ncbi:MAG: ArnT family glycosyltransferase [Myxococcaceae bacterium]
MRKWVFALLAVVLALRCAVSFGTDLYFDEAYYSLWGRSLAFGYFDHAPLIAWLLALLPPRPLALGIGGLTVFAVYWVAKRVHRSAAAAENAAVIFAAAPLAQLAGVFATPDTPLLLFWTLALGALLAEKPMKAGLAGGLALLSKYTAVLLFPVRVLAAIRERKPWLGPTLQAGAVGFLLFLPVVLWNAQRDWVGFRFQLGHGFVGHGGWRTLAEYILGQFFLGGPALFAWTAWWIAKGPAEERLLRISSAVPLLFFAVSALRARGEANWPAMAYVGSAVAMGAAPRKWVVSAALTGLVVSVIGAGLVLHDPGPGTARTPFVRTQGWSSLKALQARGAQAAFAPSYALASEIAYYAKLPVGVVGSRRPTQFDLWPPPALLPGETAIWVSESEIPPESLTSSFESVVGPTILVGGPHRFQIWRLENKR